MKQLVSFEISFVKGSVAGFRPTKHIALDIRMFLTFSSADGSITESMDISPEMPLGELKQLLEAVFLVPAKEIVLVIDGREIETTPTSRVEQLAIKDNDLILVVHATPNRSSSPARPAPVSNASPSPATAVRPTTGPVYWEGMDFAQVFQTNKSPAHIVDIIQGNQQLMLQANFHNPELAEIFRKDKKTAVRELTKYMMRKTAFHAMSDMKAKNIEEEMSKKLKQNPNDEEAMTFFKSKENQGLIDQQLATIMNEYPESMTSVLMLYINCRINGADVQAFVDSGAQTSVMSLRCAKKCGVDHLIDVRFSARMVGVGSAKSLGRIHLLPLTIEGNFFPLTVTVLDDEKGLGDKNMDFLLGLDMLKRHRVTLDLVKGVLKFESGSGFAETSFLHEKDLPEAKGGTLGFDPNRPKSPRNEDEFDDSKS